MTTKVVIYIFAEIKVLLIKCMTTPRIVQFSSSMQLIDISVLSVLIYCEGGVHYYNVIQCTGINII